MSIYMGTTHIEVSKTVGEVQSILGSHGAKSILMDYENGEVISVSFKYAVNDVDIPFVLPCRWEAIHQTMLQQMGKPRQSRMEEYRTQAKRVAWRQILRWIQAQLALTETGMVKVQEVFFPYIQDRSGQTIFERLEKNNFKALEYKGG